MGNLLGTIFGPIGTIFNAIFYGPIYNILMLIYNFIHATGIYGGFGLSIIALTLLVRCAMIPLTRKQLKSSRAMQELAPQINALKVQYRGDPQGLMKAQQDLYKEHGYSPISGCLPLLIQMPFLYALLFSFRTLLTENLVKINAPIYPFLPHLTQVPNGAFLWTNLGASDPLKILPFLAAFFTLIQLRMAMPVRKKSAPGTPSDPTMQATQTTMYIMPVITFIFALGFPSGLALYWTVGAMFASAQQYFLAGWGSLFLGIPGLEHLVPPPKELPTAMAGGTPNLGRAGARSLVASSAASRSVTAPPPESSSGGIRGFFRQLRDMGAVATSQAEEASQARKVAKGAAGTVVDSLPAAPANSVEAGRRAGKADAGTATTPASRRVRSGSEEPKLVKPQRAAELPEKAILRDATTPATPSSQPDQVQGPTQDGSNGKGGENGTLPEFEIARIAKSSGNGVPTSRPAAVTTRRPAQASTKGGGKPTSGNQGNAKSSSSRNRSANRSKGGR